MAFLRQCLIEMRLRCHEGDLGLLLAADPEARGFQGPIRQPGVPTGSDRGDFAWSKAIADQDALTVSTAP